MELIGIEKYNVFSRYNGDYDVLVDHRTGDKRDLKKITGEEWDILDQLEDNFTCLRTGQYSESMENQMKAKIEALKHRVTPDLFELIKAGKK